MSGDITATTATLPNGAWFEDFWAGLCRREIPTETGSCCDGGELLFHINKHIDYAFQPIVNIHTGTAYGYEALLRGQQKLGFKTIDAFFDKIFERGLLHNAELILRKKAIEAFSKLNKPKEARLFFNVDQRILDSQDFQPKRTRAILDQYNLLPENVCLELSEKHQTASSERAGEVINLYRGQNYKLAIDDFGAGYSGLKLLYEQQPEFVKIDRFFISGVQKDPKKRLFVSTIVNLSHVMGISVVAEGIETEEEFLACKNIGCDLVQGYFVSRPFIDPLEIHPHYAVVDYVNRKDRRDEKTDHKIIAEEIEYIPPLNIQDPVTNLFDAFIQDKERSFFPIIDNNREPLGLIREANLKEYVYTPYGKDLMANKAIGRTLNDFVERCPTADIHTETEKILEIYAMEEAAEGIIITENQTYAGFLSAASMLRVINAKNLTHARNLNPLSQLPGNNLINDYINAALDKSSDTWTLVYFDFDNFKPFNDTYGFRQGDRAIVLFADLLRKHLSADHVFLGHVGGDDFFAGFKNMEINDVQQRLKIVLDQFASDIESFYEHDAIRQGYITAPDREGQLKKFPLLRSSAAMINLHAGPLLGGSDDIVTLFTLLKKQAKASKDGLSLASLI